MWNGKLAEEMNLEELSTYLRGNWTELSTREISLILLRLVLLLEELGTLNRGQE